ncbi:uncharacterized protein cd2 isoform 1-T2 [Clarias gariepinus]|uniref:T-cell surface antigen CD2-like n=1 Tax=Clarias gariepinus TaxID=13013 RepID=UPI00234D517E|nr:T-cell surface antigen CD2-like [Clarias gariepinus]XP_053367941.1 T-cell surface antigen CD2-like [Clarias gariepinus]
MNTKGSAIGLFFCFFTLFIFGDCSECTKKLLEGETLRFELTDRALKEDDRFAIKKNNAFLVQRKNKIQTGPGTVNINGLDFQNVKLTDAGKYDVQVFDVDGTSLKSYSETVCVYAKVPKPILKKTCQKENVDFSCIVNGSKDVNYSWQKNGNYLTHDKVNLTNVEANKSKYTCTVRNELHNTTSDPVEATCYTTLFGFDFWIMVSILAGGGGLVLLLTIVLVTVACRSCKRKEKQLRDEEEFRLNYLNTAPSNGQQKSKSTARGQPAPPEPYDNVSAHDVPCETESKPKKQHRARPPPPPEEDEEEPPPPLPQPRKVKKREA